MKTLHTVTFCVAALLWAGVANAQAVDSRTIGPQVQPQATTSASAQQSSRSDANSFGTLNMLASPADTHATINNVSAPILGSYAPAMAPFSCAPTAQGGFAFAGFSFGAGGGVDKKSCVLFTAASETVRQALNTPGMPVADMQKMLIAAVNMRCQVSAEVYHAYIDAGIPCSRKPDDLPRQETQPESTRISGN